MSDPMLEETPFYAQLRGEYKSLRKLLAECGYQPTVDDLDLAHAFAHQLRHEDDIVHVPETGRHGYCLTRGIRLPFGQNPERPSEAEIYLAFESLESVTPPYGDGLRLGKLLGRTHSWRIDFWTINDQPRDICGIRRDILGHTNELRMGQFVVPTETVPQIVARIVRHHMTGM
jgi:hypothetical protein